MDRTIEEIDGMGALERVAGAIRFQTVSHKDRSRTDFTQFDGLHKFLEQAYPQIHSNLEKKTDEEKNLAYFWEGTDKALEPVALLAHQDVVPVNEKRWGVPPFSGEIRDGYVYGRGALDNKGQLIAVMESIENLLAEGFVPERSIYLLFGADEETMGEYGAAKLSMALKEKGARLHFVLDEGLGNRDGSDFGINGDIATIGICEKGIMNLKLTAKGKSGHASMPPGETAVKTLACAIARLDKHQMKSRLNYPTEQMIKALAPHMKAKYRFVFANKWLFGWLIKRRMLKTPDTAALLRTTFAPTQLFASNAPNVLAETASAVFNIRIAPGETEKDVYAHVGRYAGELEKETQFYSPPSQVSSADGKAYQEISAAAKKIFPEMVVAPYLMVGATDSRYYYSVSGNVYRFSPFSAGKEDLRRIHGDDERLGGESLKRGIEFYMHLIKATCGTAT